LSALLFFYGKVLNVHLPWLNEIGRPNAPKRLPTVLTRKEVNSIFLQIDSLEQRTFAELLYGTGLRISEALQLRIKDIEFSQNAITVLTTPLPKAPPKPTTLVDSPPSLPDLSFDQRLPFVLLLAR
jgi:integrase